VSLPTFSFAMASFGQIILPEYDSDLLFTLSVRRAGLINGALGGAGLGGAAGIIVQYFQSGGSVEDLKRKGQNALNEGKQQGKEALNEGKQLGQEVSEEARQKGEQLINKASS
jgi:hypothetical protein